MARTETRTAPAAIPAPYRRHVNNLFIEPPSATPNGLWCVQGPRTARAAGDCENCSARALHPDDQLGHQTVDLRIPCSNARTGKRLAITRGRSGRLTHDLVVHRWVSESGEKNSAVRPCSSGRRVHQHRIRRGDGSASLKVSESRVRPNRKTLHEPSHEHRRPVLEPTGQRGSGAGRWGSRLTLVEAVWHRTTVKSGSGGRVAWAPTTRSTTRLTS